MPARKNTNAVASADSQSDWSFKLGAWLVAAAVVLPAGANHNERLVIENTRSLESAQREICV